MRSWVALPWLESGSAWAISGTVSASGRPLLAADVHGDVARVPAIFSEVSLVHLICGVSAWYTLQVVFHDRQNRDHLTGATIPGLSTSHSSAISSGRCCCPGWPALLVARTANLAFAAVPVELFVEFLL